LTRSKIHRKFRVRPVSLEIMNGTDLHGTRTSAASSVSLAAVVFTTHVNESIAAAS